MREPVTSPDLLLARRAELGHVDAWREIVDAFGGRLYNVALQFTGSADEAEDLTQEMFLRIFKGLQTYRGEVPLVAWALRLSRNLCIDHYRRCKRQGRWSEVSEAILDQMPAGGDPESESSRRQELRAVHAGLRDLPDDLAELIILRDLQGWSQEEVVAALDIPLGTLKSRLHRARRLLASAVRARLTARAVRSRARAAEAS